ncbi:hypothetical protein [Amycolatopsis orientalis]|uniref:hypothetical protein n=1 Tax=Amycolatopsis orientalis TaxID=31958 RepID=UPI001268A42E|nr:hypothetical protein [Amycolatopsis orientalis]
MLTNRSARHPVGNLPSVGRLLPQGAMGDGGCSDRHTQPGSPLGIASTLFERLVPAPARAGDSGPPRHHALDQLRRPWGHNAAIPQGLGTWFDKIDRDAESSIHLIDFHQVASYLRRPVPAGALAPYL